jgi:uncharacterized protein DUF3570
MAGDDKKIGGALAAAAFGLLGAAGPGRSAAAEPQNPGSPDWNVDTAFLYYGESDGRVQDASLSAIAVRDLGDDRKFTLDLGFDTLTGASPNGAIASDRPQTFTSPSGRGTYTTSAGSVPLDSSFHDTRFAANASWSQPLARLYTVNAGIGVSSEIDYQHIGVNAGLTRDFNERNTTLNLSLAYGQDQVKPVGGVPIAFSAMPDAVDREEGIPPNRSGNSANKNVLDVLLGFTQVLGRHSLLRLNYSYSESNGYLTDPYKVLSVVDPLTGEPLVRTPPPGVEGPTGVYLFENRPDSRRRQGVYAELRQDFSGKVLSLGYRYSTDDWNVDSHTLEARLLFPMGESSSFEPHLRYYTQTAASFYRYSVANGAPLLEFASADARLADMDAYTVGIKYARKTSGGNEWNARLELYHQVSTPPSATLIGNQAANLKMPDFDAVILQFGYHFSL